MWAKAPIIAVGDLRNITDYGWQRFKNPPPTFPVGLTVVHWCQGDFQAVALIRGAIQAKTFRYIWPDGPSDCGVWSGDPQRFARLKTKVWFLREENGVLRPALDVTRPLFGVFSEWNARSSIPARQQLGEILLDPAAVWDSSRDYATFLADDAPVVVCDLLGRTECSARIRKLGSRGAPDLHAAACSALRQLGEGC